jgi:hypothetical protein
MGYVPWATKPKKKAADILDIYGSGTALAVSAVISGVEFERKFTMSESGAVSQRLRVNKTKFAKDEFALELHKANAPSMIDLGAFMDLSDAKKIDTIFRLFPPVGDVAGLTAEIETKDTELKGINKRLTGLRSTIQTLSSSRAAAGLPAGTLAETQGEIEELTVEVKKLKAQIKNQEKIEENARVEKERFEKEAADKIKADSNKLPWGAGGTAPRRAGEIPGEINSSWLRPNHQIDSGINPGDNRVDPGDSRVMPENEKATNANFQKVEEHQPQSPFADLQSVIQSLERVGSIMNSAGCTACAAGMVLKKELKKYKGKN